MKINFGKYTYVDNKKLLNSPIAPQYRVNEINSINANENPEYANQFAYDDTHFQDLINEKKYQEAADYADRFKMNNIEQQRIRENELYNLRREGRKQNAIFSRISNEEDIQAVDFYINIFKDGGNERISSDNNFNKEFIELKNKIGGNNSVTLEYTFEPEKQYLFGDYFDWLIRDNDENIDNFYAQSGLTKDMLEEAGVNISQQNGNTIIRFDKSNKYANFILYNLPTVDESRNKLRGYDANGKEVEEDFSIISNRWKYKRLIDKAREVSEKYGQPFQVSEVYSATVGKFIEDGLEDIRERYAKGELKTSEYKSLMDERYGDITSVLKSLGSGGYTIYSDAFNKNPTDETMIPLANQERSWALNQISSSDDFSLNSMIVNGEIGTLVTIYSTPEDKKNIDTKSTPEDMVKNKRYSFFIPGLFHEKAQAAINNDTNTRAEQELIEMQKWNYPIDLEEGGKLEHIGGNIFRYNGIDIPKEAAKTYLKKDMIISDAKRNLKYQFMDANGNINIPMYQDLLKRLSYTSVEDLFPNTPLTLMDGTPIDLETMFAIKGIGSNVAREYQSFMNKSVYDKLCQAYSIYDLLMKNIYNYN